MFISLIVIHYIRQKTHQKEVGIIEEKRGKDPVEISYFHFSHFHFSYISMYLAFVLSSLAIALSQRENP